MADLHKLTVQEALTSTGPGGVWTVNPVSTVHTSTAEGHTVHLDVSGASQLGVFPAGDIYFNFSNTTTDCDTDNDLRIPGDTLTFITVPLGLEASGIDGDIYFNHLSTSTTAHTVRIVEV